MAGAVQQEINEAIGSFFRATLPQFPRQDLIETSPPVTPERDEYDKYLEEQDRRERRSDFWGGIGSGLAWLGGFVVIPTVFLALCTFRDEQKRSITMTQDLTEFVNQVGEDPALTNLSEEDRALFNQIKHDSTGTPGIKATSNRKSIKSSRQRPFF